jgi:hypothetical protein
LVSEQLYLKAGENMKKLFSIMAVVSLLISCGENKFLVSITNNSTENASYTYNNISDTLSVGETKHYEVGAYTPPPANIITNPNGIASLKIIKPDHLKDEYALIDNTDSLALKVTNTLPIKVTIRTGNFIESSTSTTELEINQNDVGTATIYTREPKFTFTPADYPVLIDWRIVEDEMLVTIRLK